MHLCALATIATVRQRSIQMWRVMGNVTRVTSMATMIVMMTNSTFSLHFCLWLILYILEAFCQYLLLMNYNLVLVRYFISDISLWSFPISLYFVFLKLTFNSRETEFQILKHCILLSLKSKMVTLDSVEKVIKIASLQGMVKKYKLCLVHQCP